MVCKWQVEIDPFCQRVLAKHWPHVRRWDDVRTFPPEPIDVWRVDVLCGGFPCQGISNAGKRAGLDDERSGLWSEFARIIRVLGPRYVVVENVAAMLVLGMDRVLGDLAESGYDAEWTVLSACMFGAPHTRERVFVVAYPAGNRFKGIVCETETQAPFNLPPEALGFWDDAGSPFRNHEKLLAESGTVRMAHGVSSCLDIRPRLHAYGNSISPIVAEWLGRRIVESFAPAHFP